jgi:hypothetical protein
MKVAIWFMIVIALSTMVVAVIRPDSIEPVWLQLMVIVFAALGLLLKF